MLNLTYAQKKSSEPDCQDVNVMNEPNYEYVKISNDGNMKHIFINRPFNVNFEKNTFETKTIIFGKDKDYYSVLEDGEYNGIFKLKALQKTTFYSVCEPNEAEIIILPYYMGNSFEKVIKVIDSEKLMFVVDGKFPLTRIQQTLEEVQNNEPLKYEPKYNDILGFNAIEWVDDENTLIQIYNPQTEYIKQV